VLVACVGNIFLGDDAFGVEVGKRLRQRTMPEGVTVVDFGIRSYDLAYALMEDWSLVILVDASPRGGDPGTIYTIEVDRNAVYDPSEPIALDAHTMNPLSVLRLVNAMEGKRDRILVVGCEPATVEASDTGQFGLSQPVQAALDGAVATVEKLIAEAQRANGCIVSKGELRC
jgi:hydrogenase maturation protease